MLVTLFLFQNLPHYVPKTTIVFATQLNVPLTKQIELTNPSRKQTITSGRGRHREPRRSGPPGPSLAGARRGPLVAGSWSEVPTTRNLPA